MVVAEHPAHKPLVVLKPPNVGKLSFRVGLVSYKKSVFTADDGPDALERIYLYGAFYDLAPELWAIGTKAVRQGLFHGFFALGKAVFVMIKLKVFAEKGDHLTYFTLVVGLPKLVVFVNNQFFEFGRIVINVLALSPCGQRKTQDKKS